MSATRNISHQLVDELRRKLERRGVSMTHSQIWETVKENRYAVDAIQAGQSAYADGKHSYFRDLALAAFGDSLQQHRIDQGRGYPGMMSPDVNTLPRFGQSNDILAARQRLVTTQHEQRDITSSGWVPASGVPLHISELASTSARNRGAMEAILPVRPLPEAGTTTEVPRFTSSAAVGAQAGELAATAETDPSTAKASSPVALVAGQVDTSLQLWDFSNPSIDEALAEELGAAMAERTDLQVISGSGASGQTLGLLNVSGITSLTVNNGTPTAATNLATVGRLVATTGSAYGGSIDTILVHPRRAAYLRFKLASDLGSLATFREVASIPTNLGTNEDVVIALAANESPLLVSRPEFVAMPDVQSGNLAVRFQLRRYIALMATRKPASIGKVGGTEFINPATW